MTGSCCRCMRSTTALPMQMPSTRRPWLLLSPQSSRRHRHLTLRSCARPTTPSSTRLRPLTGRGPTRMTPSPRRRCASQSHCATAQHPLACPHFSTSRVLICASIHSERDAGRLFKYKPHKRIFRSPTPSIFGPLLPWPIILGSVRFLCPYLA